MRQIAVFLAFSGVFSTPFVFANAGDKPDVPQVVFASPSYHFGRVMRGDKIQHGFAFTNLGKEPVRILGLHAGCGCTVPSLEKLYYLPNESGVLDVVFDTTDFDGPIAKTILVMTSEPVISERVLTMSGEVASEFVADPPVVDFGTVLRLEADSQPKKIKIRTKGGVALRPDSLRYNKKFMNVTVAEQEGNTWLLEATLQKVVPTGKYRDTIYVETTSNALKNLPIPVIADIKGVVTHSPEYLDFGQLAFSHNASKELTIRGSKPFSLVTMIADILVNGEPIRDFKDMIDFQVEGGGQASLAKTVRISLKNQVAEHTGTVHGRLVLQTQMPEETVMIDLYALLLENKGTR